MRRLARLASFLRALLLRRRVEREMAREWAFHLEARVDDLVTSGMPRAEAERRARQEFGDPLRWQEQAREVRGLGLFDDLRQDVVYAVRQMRRMPGFTFVAVVTLALGIGANTAIFSVVNAVLLRPLPYPDSDRLVRMVEVVADEGGPRRRSVGMTLADMETLRAQVSTLSHVGTYGGATVLMTGPGDAARLDAVRVTHDMFAMVQAQPLIGRTFDPREMTPGEDGVVVLSFGLWRSRFDGSSAVLGQTITLDGRSHLVIGVMPAGFLFPDPQTQLWMPYAVSGPALRARVPPIGRLADGVTLEAATAEVSGILRELPTTARQMPPPPAGSRTPGATAAPLPTLALQRVHDDVVEPVRLALLVLAAAVAVVLLIACVNVTNLVLARTAARQREMAVRLALGAGRGRLVRQLLTESIVLALAGGVLGVGLAFAGVRVLQRLGATLARRDMFASGSLPRLDEIGVDGTALLFTLLLAVTAGVLSGLVPALRQRGQPVDALRAGASTRGGFGVRRGGWGQSALVIAEIAMAIVLLVGGGLFIRSFVNLTAVDPGYDPSNVVTFQVFSPRIRSMFGPNPPTGTDVRRPAAFAADLLPRLQAMPGARAAAYAEMLPMVRFRSGVRLRLTPGEAAMLPPPPPPAPGAQLPPESPDVRTVSRDFLAVMGIRVIEGRGFADGDVAGAPQVMLINRTLARSGFLGAQPIGTQVYGPGKLPWLVVGIVDDVRQYSLDQQPDPQVFVDVRQIPMGNPNVYYALRVDGDPASVLPTVRAIVRQLDAEAMVDSVATMEQLVSNSVSRPRLYAVLLGVFASVAAALAAIGIYGVMAYAVARRTREIGVRMALGAERASVLKLVLGESAALIAIGSVVGLAGAAAATRVLKGLLFGLTPFDVPTFAIGTAVFAVIALLAALIPARRATRVDPLIALRSE